MPQSSWVESQGFTAGPNGWQVGTRVELGVGGQFVPEVCCWYSEPPLADAGGAIFGESPAIWVAELYATPFDLFVSDSKDQSVVSQLLPDRVIGLRLSTVDDDDDDERGFLDAIYYLPPLDLIRGFAADTFADGLLMPAGARQGGSVVRADSWGRIRASLAY